MTFQQFQTKIVAFRQKMEDKTYWKNGSPSPVLTVAYNSLAKDFLEVRTNFTSAAMILSCIHTEYMKRIQLMAELEAGKINRKSTYALLRIPEWIEPCWMMDDGERWTNENGGGFPKGLCKEVILETRNATSWDCLYVSIED